MKRRLVPTLVFASLLASAAVYAGPWGGGGCGGGGGGRGMNMVMMEKVLDLTPDQVTQIQALRAEMMPAGPQGKPRFSQQLMQLDPTAADYQQQVDAMADAAANMSRERILQRAQMHSSMYQILTPAQRKEWAEIRAEMQLNKQAGRGRKGGWQ